LAWAEVLGASDIFIGVNALDYSGYPDCRPEFIAAFQEMARLATRAGVEGTESPVMIRTPLIEMSKRQIIELGLGLRVDYSLTTSCYDLSTNGEECGECDACQLRLKGFDDAGSVDPVRYVVRAAR
jgi:7-cyano-7-deazaguanine synthase